MKRSGLRNASARSISANCIRAVAVGRLQAGQHLRQQTRAIIAFGGHTQTPAQGFALGRQPAQQRIARRQRQAQRGGPVHVRARPPAPTIPASPAPARRLVQRPACATATVMRPRDVPSTRSATSASASPASTMRRHNASVSGAMLKSAKRAAKRQPQDAHGSLEGLAHVANTRARRSAWPPSGSTSSPSGLRAMALTVRSRRRRSSSSVTSTPVWKVKPAVAGLALGAGERVFLFGARMQEHRKIAAHGHEAPARHISGVAPTTTQS